MFFFHQNDHSDTPSLDVYKDQTGTPETLRTPRKYGTERVQGGAAIGPRLGQGGRLSENKREKLRDEIHKKYAMIPNI